LALVLHARERLGLHSGDAHSTDLLLPCLGPPPAGIYTQLGGAPHRDTNSPWPTNPAGVPLTFFCQVDFGPSLNLVGKLPGTTLLVYTDGTTVRRFGDPFFVFEWLNNVETVPEAAAPVDSPYMTCFFVRHRFPEWPTSGERLDRAISLVQETYGIRPTSHHL